MASTFKDKADIYFMIIRHVFYLIRFSFVRLAQSACLHRISWVKENDKDEDEEEEAEKRRGEGRRLGGTGRREKEE